MNDENEKYNTNTPNENVDHDNDLLSEHDLSISGSVLTSNNNTNSNKDLDSNVDLKTARDTNQVRHVKFCIHVLVLLISLIGALGIFFYIQQQELNQFETKFYDDANKILSSMGAAIDRILGEFDSLATNIVSNAHATNQTFPSVTTAHFANHAAKTLIATGAVSVFFSPVVTFEQRSEWESYASSRNKYLEPWVTETLDLQENWEGFYGPKPQNYSWVPADVIFGDTGDIPYNISRPGQLDLFIPNWQTFPLVLTYYAPANYDFYSNADSIMYTDAIIKKKAVMGKTFFLPPTAATSETDIDYEVDQLEYWCDYYTDYIPPDEDCASPMNAWIYPVIDNLDYIRTGAGQDPNLIGQVKGVLTGDVYFRTLIRNILPPGSVGIVLVVENKCSPSFSFRIDGPTVTLLDSGDQHDPKYNSMSVSSGILDLNSFRIDKSSYSGLPLETERCQLTIHLYPSDDMKNKYTTNNDIIFAFAAVAFILLPFLVFLFYDFKVTRQRKHLMSSANRSNAIISSLFPSNVRDQLNPFDGDSGKLRQSGNLIAALYPEATVLFADISGFTAWSSLRDPNQVFVLLETIYGEFDELASNRKVFKVETIGDCYVAVVGLPEPRKNHAVAMVKFAHEIINRMSRTTSNLERTLGPGTSNLRIRIGLNSGPVTAGVLRVAKGRFQLFGDTVNTAARMESNSQPGRIMCSQKTADQIIASGKGLWLTPREELIEAKGKGRMQCYWVEPKTIRSSERSSSVQNSMIVSDRELQVLWMAELLEALLTDVLSKRVEKDFDTNSSIDVSTMSTASPRDEVTDSIVVPAVDSEHHISPPSHVALSVELRTQIHDYVKLISLMHRDNPFHNFERACHVVMSIQKLLHGVVQSNESSISLATYGLTSNPLSKLALVFSAMILDLDHQGVSNEQLIKENITIARQYKYKSIAEQNSICLSWDILMEPRFATLRESIMPDHASYTHFHQVVVNAVIATDPNDLDLKRTRQNRWNMIFVSDSDSIKKGEVTKEDSNILAGILVDFIIQTSDVSYTMQHWHIFQEWNRRLLLEKYIAYSKGRSEKDPTISWYKDRLTYFDIYVIPLVKKLKVLEVFGAQCNELFENAVNNRDEWAAKGESLVEESKVLMLAAPQAEVDSLSWTKSVGDALTDAVHCRKDSLTLTNHTASSSS